MRLFELTGTKQYKHKSLEDVLDDFKKAGGEILGSGVFATTIGNPKWNHVFKFFTYDDVYLKFVDWVMQNNDSSLPKIYKKVKLVPFYKRSADLPYVYVIKMERLQLITDPFLIKNLLIYMAYAQEVFEDNIEVPEILKKGYEKYPSLEHFCKMYWLKYIPAGLPGFNDIHLNNVMQRTNGELVLTDPKFEEENDRKNTLLQILARGKPDLLGREI